MFPVFFITMKNAKNMKNLLLAFVAVWWAVSASAQKTADIGLWGGTSVYFGDLDDAPPLESLNPNFGAYFRYNFNARVGLRAQFLTGTFAGDGVIESVPYGFSKSVQDLSLQVEINYLNYILGVKNTPFTSYVMAGVGVAYFPYEMDPSFIATFNPLHNKGNTLVDESIVATTIPFGIGFKFTLGKRLGLGMEYQMRKLFDDELDNLDDPLAFINNDREEVIYNDYSHNNDWSGYLGIHVTYKIYMGKKACPAYESKD